MNSIKTFRKSNQSLYRYVDGHGKLFPWIPGNEGISFAAELSMRNEGGYIERYECKGEECEESSPDEHSVGTIIATFFGHLGFWCHTGTCTGHEFQVIESVQDQAFMDKKVGEEVIKLDYQGVHEVFRAGVQSVIAIGKLASLAACLATLIAFGGFPVA